MIDLLLRTAIALVRAWTRVYTWQMPADEREARRSEIESDLWELQHDADTSAGTGAALQPGEAGITVPGTCAERSTGEPAQQRPD
jgi:hypothetical protein